MPDGSLDCRGYTAQTVALRPVVTGDSRTAQGGLVRVDSERADALKVGRRRSGCCGRSSHRPPDRPASVATAKNRPCAYIARAVGAQHPPQALTQLSLWVGFAGRAPVTLALGKNVSPIVVSLEKQPQLGRMPRAQKPA